MNSTRLMLTDGTYNEIRNVDPEVTAELVRRYLAGEPFEWVTFDKYTGRTFRWPSHMITEVRLGAPR
jgi:hypothetical protein